MVVVTNYALTCGLTDVSSVTGPVDWAEPRGNWVIN